MADEKPQIDIQQYIKLLLRRKLMWIIPTILFSIGAVTYASILPDVYQSRCVIAVEESKVLDNLLSRRANNKGPNARSLVGAVSERMLGWQSLTQLIKILDLDKGVSGKDENAMEELYKKIRNKITVKATKSNFIVVTYQSENPEINYRMVDGLVSNFMEYSLKETRTEAEETVEFIDADLKRQKKDLEMSERQLQQFEEEHFDALPGSEGGMMARLTNAKGELVTVEKDIMILEEKIGFLDESIDKEDKTITGEVTRIPNPMVKELKDQITKLEIEVNSLRAKYFDEHPSIVQRLKELESLKEMLAQEPENTVSEEKIVNNPMYEDIMEKGFSAQLQLKVLQRRRKEIESTITRLEESIKSIPALRQEQTELKRDYGVKKALYEERLKQKARADLVKEMSLDAKTNPFSIIEPARISYVPVKAVKIKIVGMGVIMGLGLGVGLVIGLDQINPKFKTMEEVQNYLNIPGLGMIPTIMTNTEIERNFRKKIIISGSLAAFLIVTTVVCLVVEPIKSIVSNKATSGWGQLVEIVRNR